jgi:hypothetical protein
VDTDDSYFMAAQSEQFRGTGRPIHVVDDKNPPTDSVLNT